MAGLARVRVFQPEDECYQRVVVRASAALDFGCQPLAQNRRVRATSWMLSGGGLAVLHALQRPESSLLLRQLNRHISLGQLL